VSQLGLSRLPQAGEHVDGSGFIPRAIEITALAQRAYRDITSQKYAIQVKNCYATKIADYRAHQRNDCASLDAIELDSAVTCQSWRFLVRTDRNSFVNLATLPLAHDAYLDIIPRGTERTFLVPQVLCTRRQH
jgi:hypothetical protein